jgi:hypothetical protein
MLLLSAGQVNPLLHLPTAHRNKHHLFLILILLLLHLVDC